MWEKKQFSQQNEQKVDLRKMIIETAWHREERIAFQSVTEICRVMLVEIMNGNMLWMRKMHFREIRNR